MCLGIPGKVVEVTPSDLGIVTGKVDFGGVVKDVNLSYSRNVRHPSRVDERAYKGLLWTACPRPGQARSSGSSSPIRSPTRDAIYIDGGTVSRRRGVDSAADDSPQPGLSMISRFSCAILFRR